MAKTRQSNAQAVGKSARVRWERMPVHPVADVGEGDGVVVGEGEGVGGGGGEEVGGDGGMVD